MAFDGIVTKAVTHELNNIIGFKIDKVFQPDKNTIILGLYKQSSNLSLLCSINSSTCRLHLTTHQQKNPLTAPNFCMFLRKHLIGLKIKNIYTIDLERIVFIDLENNENPNKPIFKKLIIELMGKHSNIILTDSNNIIIDSMRHTNTEENSNRDIYPTSKYLFPTSSKYSFLELIDFEDFYSKIEPTLTSNIVGEAPNINNLNINNFNLDKIIANTFNGISLSFIQNIIKEQNITEISTDALKSIYNKISEIIKSKNLKIMLTPDKKDYYLYTNLENSTRGLPHKLCD